MAITETHPSAREALQQIAAHERARRLTPPPTLTLSQWAEDHARLSSEDSAEKGRWRPERAPYQREIMDAFTNPLIHTVAVMSAAQIGKTLILKVLMGYYMDQDTAPILVVVPTVSEAQVFSKVRLAPMLRDTPKLRGVVKDATSRNSGNTLLVKEFPGGHLTLVGANSPSGLSAKPIRVVLGDEVDRWPESAGTEGDPMDLARARQRTFWNRKAGWFSTPTLESGRINRAYLEGDQRQFWVPCPDCGLFQLLRFGNLRGERGADGDIIPASVAYPCAGCGVLWQEHDKPRLLAAGEWRAQAPFNGIASFHVSGMLSPWTTWAEVQDDYNRAKGDWARRQVFVNTVLGEPWKEAAGGLEPKGLELRIGVGYPDPPAEVPDGVGLLTMGVDVQGDRLEFTVWGWGAGLERWRIHHAELSGEPALPQVWEELERWRLKEWRRADGHLMRVYATAVDAGHHTRHVYAYCRPRYTARVYAVRGSSTPGSPWLPKRPSRNNQGNTPVYFLGTEAGKDEWYGSLRVGAEGPKYVHFDRGTDAEYLRQITAEYPEKKQVAGRGWIRRYVLPDGKHSEALDCAVYAQAALDISRFPIERLDRATTAPSPPPDPVPTPPAPPALTRPNLGQALALQRALRGIRR